MCSFKMQAMVKSLRIGGVIIESTPFSGKPEASGKEDLRVHLYASVPMHEAMGPNMERLAPDGSRNRQWKKIA